MACGSRMSPISSSLILKSLDEPVFAAAAACPVDLRESKIINPRVCK
jgi:hypothetical protein